ncbi:MAG: hypothetical protein H6729_03000 [Deltaproteobacteria bacterium]|nr:hypothetical protein [Deltaproteobacteria bacterium]
MCLPVHEIPYLLPGDDRAARQTGADFVQVRLRSAPPQRTIPHWLLAFGMAHLLALSVAVGCVPDPTRDEGTGSDSGVDQQEGGQDAIDAAGQPLDVDPSPPTAADGGHEDRGGGWIDDASVDATADAAVGDAESVGTPPPRSGTRLKAIFYDTGSGFRAFAGWSDSARGAPCSPAVAGDGQTRCLPTTQDVSFGPKVFKDPACTEQVVALVGGSISTTHDDSHCPPRQRYYQAGARTDIPIDSLLFVRRGSECRPETPYRGYPETYRVYDVGPEIPAESFSRLYMMPGRRLGTTRPVYFESEDGAFSWSHFEDLTLNSRCEIRLSSDGQVRCLPTGESLMSFFFADASCTQPAVPWGSDCPAPPVLSEISSETCRWVTRLYEVGDEVSSVYSVFGDGTCSIREAQAAQMGLTAGPEISPSVFSPFELETVGDLRLRHRVFRTSGVSFDLGWTFDSRWETTCYFARASDHVMRCLPGSTATIDGLFADAQCTRPIAASFGESCSDVGRFARSFTSSETRVFELGEALPPGSSVYWKSGQGCVAIRPENSRFFAVGAEVAPAEFVPVAEIIDR